MKGVTMEEKSSSEYVRGTNSSEQSFVRNRVHIVTEALGYSYYDLSKPFAHVFEGRTNYLADDRINKLSLVNFMEEIASWTLFNNPGSKVMAGTAMSMAGANRCDLSVLAKIERQDDILTAHYSPDGNDVYSGSINGDLFKFEARSLRLSHKLTDDESLANRNPVTSVAPILVAGEDRLLSSHVSGWVKVWDTKNLKCLLTIREKTQIMGVVPLVKKEKFLTLGEDARMRLYDMNTGQLATTFENTYTKEKMTGHDSKIFAAKFHPKNINEFVSGGWDDTVHFWDIRKSQSVRYFAGAHICGEGLDIDPAGDLVLTCAYQPKNSCRVWNYSNAKLYMDINTESARLYCGRYLGPKFIVTGSSDPGNLRLINLFNYGTLSLFKSGQVGVYCVDFHRRGDKRDNILNCRILMAAGNVLSELDCRYSYTA